MEIQLTGTVKNNADGSVHIIATGTDEQLKALTDWCKEGPPMAKVLDVTTSEMALTNFDNFVVTR